MRLRTRILILVCVAALPLLLVQLWFGYNLARSAQQQAFTNILVRTRLVAGEQERTIEAARQLLITLARQPYGCGERYTSLVVGLDGISYLSFTRADGTEVCAGSGPLLSGMPVPRADATLMRRVIETAAFRIGVPAVPGGRAVLQLMSPVIDINPYTARPEIIGVVTVGFNFDWLPQRLERLSLSSQTRVTVADREGVILLQYPETALRTGEQITPSALALLHNSPAGVVGRLDPNGEDRILGHVPPSEAGGLVVLVSINAAHALQPANVAMRYLLLGVVGTALLTLVLALLGTHLVVLKPLALLTSVVRRRRDGDQSVRMGALSGTPEVTELGRLIDEIADLVALRDAELVQASVDKAHAMAAIAHDKRHKLQVLQILLDRLRSMPEGLVDPKILITAQNSLDDLSHAITQLMWAAALETNSMPEPDIYQVSVMYVLENVAAETEIRANAKGVALRLVPSTLMVRTDPAILTAIVQNFADNAVKYTQHGKILIGVKRVGDMARIVVADTGIGVPEEHQKLLFREFHQVDQSHDGIGLGLGIVARLAPRIGAHVHLRSKVGRGSAFMVDIPMART